jgi:hypothetical protein
MLTDFYIAFSPVCFSLLGLWLVVIQINAAVWLGDQSHWRRAYGVALHFALPGTMSLLALIEPQNPDVWRLSFAIISLSGAVVLALIGRISGNKALDHLAQAVAILVYLAIGVVAIIPQHRLLVEAMLLILLVFLGFNVALRLMYTAGPPPAPAASAEQYGILEINGGPASSEPGPAASAGELNAAG